jgi:hypothetical protein
MKYIFIYLYRYLYSSLRKILQVQNFYGGLYDIILDGLSAGNLALHSHAPLI